MLVYAHRAGRGLAPENTLHACQAALKLAIDFIDFDIGMTKDGYLVVTHDLFLNCDFTRDILGNFIKKPIPIYSLNYAELAAYNVGAINPQSAYAAFFPEQRSVEYAQIPLLTDAIHFVRNQTIHRVGFQIEIKIDSTQTHLSASPELYAEALYRVLKEHEIIEQTEVQSFDYSTLLCLQKKDSKIKTTYLTKPFEEYPPLSYWRSISKPLHFTHFILKMIKILGGSCWGPFQMDVTQSNVAQAKSFGLKVVPWGYPEKEGTEFNYSQIAKLIEWGVDGIITDRPDTLLKLVG